MSSPDKRDGGNRLIFHSRLGCERDGGLHVLELERGERLEDLLEGIAIRQAGED